MRVTDSRSEVLEKFLASKKTLNHNDLEFALGSKFDRVTLYRTLHSFVKQGILHKIADNDGSLQYALCEDCGHERHDDEHVHFKCMICNAITCLDHVRLPLIKLPDGYSYQSGEMMITGTCKSCNG